MLMIGNEQFVQTKKNVKPKIDLDKNGVESRNCKLRNYLSLLVCRKEETKKGGTSTKIE